MSKRAFIFKKPFRYAVLLLGLLLTLCGCSTILRLQADFVAPMISELVDQAANNGSSRVVREGIAGNTLLVTAFSEISPNNNLLLEKSTYLYCAYGLMVEDADPEFASELYSLGKEYGLRALKQNRCFRKGMENGKHIPELTDCLGRGYKAALLWAGIADGLWIFRNMDDSAALIEIADAVALVERSIELDPNYFFGIGKLFLGAYYALIPDFFGTGGGPEASARMFAEARAASGGRLLMVDVFEARFLDTQMKNKTEYIRKLEHVLAADPDILPEYRSFTAIAKQKARFFLDHMDEFFI
jgi:hypothetical protein